MKVLVTGSTGFVGSRLICHIRDRGWRLAAPVRRSARHEDEVALGTFTGNTDWSAVLRDVDVVIHLAGRAHSVDQADGDVEAIYRAANGDVTERLARCAIEAGVARFIYVSSIKVNGEETAPGRAFEADDVPAPEDVYGRSKLDAELRLKAACQDTPMRWTIIRPPLVYGRGVKANFRTMVRLVINRIPLPLKSVINRRSLVNVDNLVDLIMVCAVHPGAVDQVFLVSDADDMSTPDMLQRIAGVAQVKSMIFPFPVVLLFAFASLIGKRSFIRRVCSNLQVDIEKNRRKLDWSPRASVEAGLLESVQGCRAEEAHE